ncbi:hypothetical protein INR49_019444 [Caranx melampygus]|nr:hypothetical protein INR49_019444 [Caranx melampygus]
MDVFHYSRVDFLFTCLGLVFLLTDIGLDVAAAVSLYQERALVSLGFLLLFLLGSSLLVQAFSWLWYSYDSFKRDTTVESCLTLGQLRLLHLLQLGIYFRHAGVFEVSVRSFFSNVTGDFAVFLTHDLSLLRIFETFAESSPQLVLMLTIILQRRSFDPITVMKAVGSASAIAFSVTTYHRSMRSFLPEKKRQTFSSSVIYFLWNLLLLSSRLTSLALFSSVFPCFIIAHFLCSWLLLLFFVWRAGTDFMESQGGEWLYRGTVAMILYFSWFNVGRGQTRTRMVPYHSFIMADVLLLCSLWCWKTSSEDLYFEIPLLYSVVTMVTVVSVYVLGLLLELIYYRCFHPNLSKGELKGGSTALLVKVPSATTSGDQVDFGGVVEEGEEEEEEEEGGVSFRMGQAPRPLPPPTVKENKRMRRLAENFYT